MNTNTPATDVRHIAEVLGDRLDRQNELLMALIGAGLELRPAAGTSHAANSWSEGQLFQTGLQVVCDEDAPSEQRRRMLIELLDPLYYRPVRSTADQQAIDGLLETWTSQQWGELVTVAEDTPVSELSSDEFRRFRIVSGGSSPESARVLSCLPALIEDGAVRLPGVLSVSLAASNAPALAVPGSDRKSLPDDESNEELAAGSHCDEAAVAVNTGQAEQRAVGLSLLRERSSAVEIRWRVVESDEVTLEVEPFPGGPSQPPPTGAGAFVAICLGNRHPAHALFSLADDYAQISLDEAAGSADIDVARQLLDDPAFDLSGEFMSRIGRQLGKSELPGEARRRLAVLTESQPESSRSSGLSSVRLASVEQPSMTEIQIGEAVEEVPGFEFRDQLVLSPRILVRDDDEARLLSLAQSSPVPWKDVVNLWLDQPHDTRIAAALWQLVSSDVALRDKLQSVLSQRGYEVLDGDLGSAPDAFDKLEVFRLRSQARQPIIIEPAILAPDRQVPVRGSAIVETDTPLPLANFVDSEYRLLELEIGTSHVFWHKFGPQQLDGKGKRYLLPQLADAQQQVRDPDPAERARGFARFYQLITAVEGERSELTSEAWSERREAFMRAAESYFKELHLKKVLLHGTRYEQVSSEMVEIIIAGTKDPAHGSGEILSVAAPPLKFDEQTIMGKVVVNPS